jgi:hypothetical protein
MCTGNTAHCMMHARLSNKTIIPSNILQSIQILAESNASSEHAIAIYVTVLYRTNVYAIAQCTSQVEHYPRLQGMSLGCKSRSGQRFCLSSNGTTVHGNCAVYQPCGIFSQSLGYESRVQISLGSTLLSFVMDRTAHLVYLLPLRLLVHH